MLRGLTLMAALLVATSTTLAAEKPSPPDNSTGSGKGPAADKPAAASDKSSSSKKPEMMSEKPTKPAGKKGPEKPAKDGGKVPNRSVIGRSAKVPLPARDFAPISATIDREIDRRLAEAHLSASDRADDAEFFRRVTIDIIGRIPSYEETAWFLASTDPDKRRKWIDDLLASPGYGEHFRDIWRRLIEPPNDVNGKSNNDLFGPWLAEQFNSSRGWNQIVHDMLIAKGEIRQTPEAGFILANSAGGQPQPDKLAIATAKLFLGVRLECAQCHDHPFLSWKQTDFWATAAFFSRVRYSDVKGGGNRNSRLVECTTAEAAARESQNGSFKIAPDGAIVIPADFKKAGTVVKPKLLAGEDVSLGDDGAYRVRFADWATSPDNRFFAPAAVNRLWSHFFARGLFKPIDDYPIDEKTPGVHADLLQTLAKELAASGFDQKHMIRVICNSQAYQRTSRGGAETELDKDLFSHMALKPLTPEVLYDSLVGLTNVSKIKPPAVYRKGGARDPRGIFLEMFRTPSDAADPSALGYGIPQFLRRMNAEDLNVSPVALSRLGVSRMKPEDAIEAIYYAALSRPPTENERRIMADYVSRRSDTEEAYQGVLWILLNSGEFVLNH